MYFNWTWPDADNCHPLLLSENDFDMMTDDCTTRVHWPVESNDTITEVAL